VSLQAIPQPKAPGSASANASSRKKAKIRKQNLKDMLARTREDASHSSGGGFGLDLLDLMKKATLRIGLSKQLYVA
jgi:hypothetical protein